MKSKPHALERGGDVGASAQVLEQPQHNYPLPAQVPTQPLCPIMAAHFADGRKALRSRMQRKLEDDRGEANTRSRGWNASICMFLSTSTGAAIDCPEKVSIPKTAQAVAAHCFPVNVTLRTPQKQLLRPLVDNTTIQVVRSVVLSAEGKKSAHTCGIGRANVQQIESELVDENTRIIRAGTKAGVLHGEYSWKIGDIAEVKVGPFHLPQSKSHFSADAVDLQYFIRVTVVHPETKKVLFQHDEDIEMFTHENTDSGFELLEEPASGLLLGTSLHAGTRAFR